MVCTSGWPSTAALKLLQMLVDQSPDIRLYYSGDFDLKGLQIAASLMARYTGRCYPWRFDVESYAFALRAGGVAASSVELAALSVLPEVFTPSSNSDAGKEVVGLPGRDCESADGGCEKKWLSLLIDDWLLCFCTPPEKISSVLYYKL